MTLPELCGMIIRNALAAAFAETAVRRTRYPSGRMDRETEKWKNATAVSGASEPGGYLRFARKPVLVAPLAYAVAQRRHDLGMY